MDANLDFKRSNSTVTMQNPSVGIDLTLKNCDGSTLGWTVLTFRGASEETIDEPTSRIDLKTIRPYDFGDSTVVSNFDNSKCSFLSKPTSHDFWPSADILDNHTSCIKMR